MWTDVIIQQSILALLTLQPVIVVYSRDMFEYHISEVTIVQDVHCYQCHISELRSQLVETLFDNF